MVPYQLRLNSVLPPSYLRLNSVSPPLKDGGGMEERRWAWRVIDFFSAEYNKKDVFALWRESKRNCR